jgi:hypothetical protein
VPDPKLHWDWLPLSDDALVVRGGTMQSRGLWMNANTVVREARSTGSPDVWGICVGAADSATAFQIALQMPYRGDKMRVASLGGLRAAGFDLVMVDERPHALLLLKEEPTGEHWEGWDRLRRLFTEPQTIPR